MPRTVAGRGDFLGHRPHSMGSYKYYLYWHCYSCRWYCAARIPANHTNWSGSSTRCQASSCSPCCRYDGWPSIRLASIWLDRLMGHLKQSHARRSNIVETNRTISLVLASLMPKSLFITETPTKRSTVNVYQTRLHTHNTYEMIWC